MKKLLITATILTGMMFGGITANAEEANVEQMQEQATTLVEEKANEFSGLETPEEMNQFFEENLGLIEENLDSFRNEVEVLDKKNNEIYAYVANHQSNLGGMNIENIKKISNGEITAQQALDAEKAEAERVANMTESEIYLEKASKLIEGIDLNTIMFALDNMFSFDNVKTSTKLDALSAEQANAVVKSQIVVYVVIAFMILVWVIKINTRGSKKPF
ncbi:hypothetical protein ABHA52_12445 [Enterococcus faecium]|uniref:hypothetical protein n=1 Tax=Enterococcus faecium TaxID=1352 RepID=UPI0011074694|nr:hypothetical protein [Enterococcus faecium]MDB7485049.1 hypothetical protein [Enterococcus faecium]MDB7490103.1 hypothetical protein [Enterococcus faecium]MDB7492647.1 hypothetical protein [Enterococcus faecium]MDB7495241.1 hypothetical protein [Enterococcus faecium]MDB7497795.1 hypothetical protein [Enterococcus faecium]